MDLQLVTAVDQDWATNITYIPPQHIFLYEVAIVDLFTRKVLRWKLSKRLDTGYALRLWKWRKWVAARHRACTLTRLPVHLKRFRIQIKI